MVEETMVKKYSGRKSAWILDNHHKKLKRKSLVTGKSVQRILDEILEENL